jgi:serine/threonine protein kinase HipA of HipAB toxin-antitoxin module
LEKLLIDIENAYEAKKANIEKTRKIAAEVEKEMEHPTGHGRPLRFEQIEEEWASDDSWMYGKDED